MLLDIFYHDLTNYENYRYFCLRNCIRQMLEYYSVRNAPLFIGASYDLILLKGDLYKYGFHIDCINKYYPVLPAYSDRIKKFLPYSVDTAQVWAVNKDRLYEGTPLITVVDVFYLDYRNEFKKNHGSHAVILCGHDEAKNAVGIIDWSDSCLFKGWVSLDNYLMARSSDNPFDSNPFSGCPIHNEWIEVDKEGWEADEWDLLYKTIKLDVEQAYRKCTNYQGNSVCTGVNTIKDVLEIIKRHASLESGLKRDFLRYLHEQLFILFKTRKMFALYLQMVPQRGLANSLDEMLSLLETDIKVWESMMFLILKATMVDTDMLFTKIIDIYDSLIKYEEIISCKLENLKVAVIR